MSSIRIGAAVLSLFMTMATITSAHATLIGEEANGQSVTLDTASDLLWLDASNTLGLSSNAALADFPGYQLATLSEVEQLFEDAGVPAADVPAGRYTNPAPGDLLVSTLGYTYLTTFGIPDTAYWDYDVDGLLAGSSADDLEEVEVRNSGLGDPGVYMIPYSNVFLPSQSSSNYFVFLVAQATTVPEPASLSLFATALLGLLVLRRHRRSG